MVRIFVILLMLPVLFFGAILAASELGGEVVQLETQREDGRFFETSLWVVDIDRTAWLRGSDSDSDWVVRLRANPEVFMTRAGQRVAYQARIIDGLAGRINLEMHEKYGRADDLISIIRDDEKVVSIRLDRS